MPQTIKHPGFGEDMTIAISLTGITRLTQSKYKARHNKLKEVVEAYPRKFILRKDDKHEIQRLADLKAKKRKKKIEDPQTKKAPAKPKSYQVNKKEVTHRIRNMVNAMKGEKQLYFWTVTFPEKTPDDTAFLCLNKWMTRLRKEKMLKTYLWVSERQENGTIHFHIAINHRMDVKKANRYMRACLFTCIDNKEIEFSRDAALKYNGVDIAKDRKTKRVTNFAKKHKGRALTNYLTKYVSKNQDGFPHLAWHSSRDYSNLIITVRITETEFNTTKLELVLDMTKKYSNEWFEFMPWKKTCPPEIEKYLSKVNNMVFDLLNNKN